MDFKKVYRQTIILPTLIKAEDNIGLCASEAKELAIIQICSKLTISRHTLYKYNGCSLVWNRDF